MSTIIPVPRPSDAILQRLVSEGVIDPAEDGKPGRFRFDLRYATRVPLHDTETARAIIWLVGVALRQHGIAEVNAGDGVLITTEERPQ